MKLQKSIIAIFALIIFAMTANAQFGDLINKTKNKIDKAQKKVEQTTGQTSTQTNGSLVNSNGGFGGAMRGAKLGQPGSIGLSKSPIDPNNWQAAKYETSFKTGDTIYAIVFFGEPVTKLGINGENQEMIVWMSMDGSNTLSDYWGIPIKAEQRNATFVTLPISPRAADIFNCDDATAASRFSYFAQKYAGNALRLTFMSGGDQQATLPGVTFDFTAPDTESKYAALIAEYDRSVSANSDKANASVEIPKVGMRNAALEKQFAAMINGAGYDWKMLKLIIASPDWQLKRYEISGVIEARYLVTRNIVKEPTGACRIQSVVFYQDYNGSGYNKTYMDVAMGRTDDVAVSCEKAK